MAEGWDYLRIDDPGNNNYNLVSVQKSNGEYLQVSDNAWLTHKTVHSLTEGDYEENYLHIFDHSDGLGEVYTVTYRLSDIDAPEVTAVSAEDITWKTSKSYTFNVTYDDDSSVDTASVGRTILQ